MPRRLTVALAALMAAQSLFGLTLDHHYRDPDWIKATWFGNDWFTLLVAVPLLGISTACAARGSVRGLLFWLGTLAFAAYNYAFYLLGASLNVFFPLYVAAVLLSGITLIVALSRIDVPGMAGTFMPSMRVRLMGIVLLTMGLGLSGVWIGVWGAYAFANRPAPVDPEVFKLVAALDLSLMVPGLISGGVLLWRRRPWGYVVAPVSGILATLYLAVLCVNSAIAITRGLTPWPGELPIWIPLALVSAAAAAGLVVNAGRDPEGYADRSKHPEAEVSCSAAENSALVRTSSRHLQP